MEPAPLSTEILNRLDDPAALETLYHRDEPAFRNAFPDALARAPQREALRVWEARLRYNGVAVAPTAAPVPQMRQEPAVVVQILLLALVAGTYAKLPGLLGGISEDWFYPRHLASIVLLPLAAFFTLFYRPARPIALAVWGAIAVVSVFQAVRPGADNSDTLLLAALHLPVLLWALAGALFAGSAWREDAPRTAYLRYTGELLVTTGLVLLGGGLLSGITVALFAAIDIDIAEFWFEWIGVYGAVAAPLVAAFLVSLRSERQRLAPTLARVFGPLVLVTLTVYLITLAVQGANPVHDREVLIVFNGMLVGVLILVVLLPAERPDVRGRHWIDAVGAGLVALALIIDAVALWAIGGRLLEGGLTPNRLAVLGANGLMLAHLAGLLALYVRFYTGKATAAALDAWTARFLPLYAGWASIVVIGFALLFGFR